jgi:chondroitin AC lyase
LAAFDFRFEKLRAHKAWFCFDREIVCLGADIVCPTEDAVLTSVNQCLLRGGVLVSDGRRERKLPRGKRFAGNVSWVHHDGVGYVFPEPAAVNVAGEEQTGSWHDVSTYDSARKVRRDVFSLWIDHGVRPRGVDYVYAVLPEVSPQELAGYAKDWSVTVLVNKPALQAVRHEGLRLTQAAFYRRGRLKVPGGLSVAVDKPCLVMVEESAGAVRLSVSNPENEPGTIVVEIGARLTGPGCIWQERKRVTRVSVELPSGVYAGQTAVIALSPA